MNVSEHNAVFFFVQELQTYYLLYLLLDNTRNRNVRSSLTFALYHKRKANN